MRSVGVGHGCTGLLDDEMSLTMVLFKGWTNEHTQQRVRITKATDIEGEWDLQREWRYLYARNDFF